MQVTDWLRIYVVAVAAIVMAIGTCQWRRWQTFMPENKLAWLAIAGLNLAIGFGTLQSINRHIPGGSRSYVLAVAMTWLLCAVCYRPWIWTQLYWRKWRRAHKKEIR